MFDCRRELQGETHPPKCGARASLFGLRDNSHSGAEARRRDSNEFGKLCSLGFISTAQHGPTEQPRSAQLYSCAASVFGSLSSAQTHNSPQLSEIQLTIKPFKSKSFMTLNSCQMPKRFNYGLQGISKKDHTRSMPFTSSNSSNTTTCITQASHHLRRLSAQHC